MANQNATGIQGLDLSVPGALEWRCIGPFRGSRAIAAVGHPTEKQVFYFGGPGGVWKTEDGGVYWENISDGFIKTSAVGAMAISESDPNVLYVGMGESCVAVPRLHWTSQADGVYKSTDGGKTWANVGLETTQHISRIRIHPEDPDLVYVAVVGHLEGPAKGRGVYRSKDGGETWEQVLFRAEDVGCNDLSMDPNNPRILYAGMWQVRRSYWNTYSGGPETSLYRTTDGGDTWTDLTNNPGITKGNKGRFAVAAPPARAGRVWALFDQSQAPGASPGSPGRAEDKAEGGLFRSDDGGATWEQMSDNPELTIRPHYYNHVFADPEDPETVYVLNQGFWKSVDGGRTFFLVETPHYDHHDLWIDPRSPRRMIHANDGGASVSFNGGATWSSIYNQPTAEFYHVTTDTQVPYRVYATQQDNSAISVPSRSNVGAITWSDCYAVGSSESGHIVVRPDNPNIVTSGALGSSPGSGAIMLRYDHATGQSRSVTVWPDLTNFTMEGRKYRFEWDNPIVISPHDQNVIYSAANVVFRTTNEGTSWEVISPDLTRNDLEEREEIDPVTNIAPFERGTITRLAESPIERGIFWVGTSDGLIQISRDGGGTWQNVTPPELPEWTPVDTIEASPHDAATAYVAANGYQHGDYRPHLYKTTDYGETWETIVNGIREIDFTRVVREDPGRRGLLYAGTEGGPYVSFDGGANWQSLQLNLPRVPIHDMVVKDGDLVVATHGRSLWILDDVTSLHQVTDQTTKSSAHLFKPRRAYRFVNQPSSHRRYPLLDPRTGRDKVYHLGLGTPATYLLPETPDGQELPIFLDAGKNPPDGVQVYYYLRERPEGEVKLTFLDGAGREIRTFSSGADDEEAAENGTKGPRVPVESGMNRFLWDMRYPGPVTVPSERTELRRLIETLAPPGTYQVQLMAGGDTYTQSFEINKDPRSSASQEDLDAQHELMLNIRDRISEANGAVIRIRSVRRQVERYTGRAEGHSGAETLKQAADVLTNSLAAVEGELLLGPGSVPGKEKPSRGSFYARGLVSRLGPLSDTVAMADGVPTRQSYEVFSDLTGRVEEQIERLQVILDTDLDAFTTVVHELDIPAITT